MRHGQRIVTTIGLVLFATAAHAAPGDYRLLSGTLVWPQVLMTERLAVVKGDDGIMYFAELGSPSADSASNFSRTRRSASINSARSTWGFANVRLNWKLSSSGLNRNVNRRGFRSSPSSRFPTTAHGR